MHLAAGFNIVGIQFDHVSPNSIPATVVTLLMEKMKSRFKKWNIPVIKNKVIPCGKGPVECEPKVPSANR